jgi:large subunit ribosomal protein L13
MRTYVAKATEARDARKWWVIDAKGKPLGRVASAAAVLLRGKHKASFSPHLDVGDFVIVVNAAQVSVTGNKAEGKKYFRYSGHPGGMREETFSHLLNRRPEAPVELAVKGMLPKGTLGRQQFHKLKVYPTAEHPHAAQLPQIRELK